jgi:hypothetical protein
MTVITFAFESRRGAIMGLPFRLPVLTALQSSGDLHQYPSFRNALSEDGVDGLVGGWR